MKLYSAVEEQLFIFVFNQSKIITAQLKSYNRKCWLEQKVLNPQDHIYPAAPDQL